MITNLELINYKSFLNTTVDINPLTILAGLNSSGKSSMIQAVNMILSYHKNHNIELSDHISPRLQKSKSSKDNFFKLTMQMEPPGFLDLEVHIDGETYDFTGCANPKERELPFLQYISASRLGPQNILELNPEYKNVEIGTKGEYIIDYIDKNRDIVIADRLIKLDKENNRLWENIDAWLQYISPGVSLGYEIKRDQNASYPSYNKILPTETGFGLSYTLPVITASLMPVADKESLLLLENPEGHLHPKGQAAMGELLSLAVSAGKQIICETHSDHIINSIRAAVKEKKIENKQVTILFFENVLSDTAPHTKVTPIAIDRNGSLSNYPDNFMDEWSIQLAKLI
jgi:predicted ATPase